MSEKKHNKSMLAKVLEVYDTEDWLNGLKYVDVTMRLYYADVNDDTLIKIKQSFNDDKTLNVVAE
jgi:hypothetical protein